MRGQLLTASVAAATLTGFSAVANAQSNVMLYGVVDSGFNYTKVDGNSRSGIDSGLAGQSRWGIRGTEQINGDLKAVFMLESGFSADNGSLASYGTAGTKLFGRYSYVGLDSVTYGRLIMGRTLNLSAAWTSFVASPFHLAWSTATIGTTFAYNDPDLGSARADNAIYYFSPVVANLQGAVGYSFAPNSGTTGNEVAGSRNNDRLLNLGLRYDNGPVKAAATYEQLDPRDSTPNNGTIKNLSLGASYDFGVATVHAGFARVNNLRNASYNGAPGFVTPTRNDDTAWTLGFSAPLRKGKLLGSYQTATKSEVKQWALGYQYNLSKRTDLYSFFTSTDYRNFTESRNFSGRQFALGLQHRF